MDPASRARVSVRLYVVFSLMMAVAATVSGLLLLYLARPYVTGLAPRAAAEATVVLFSGAAVAAALAAVGGLGVGMHFAGRLRGIVQKAEALSPFLGERPRGADDLGFLDATLGRLTLSMDRFVRDSEILARLPEGMMLLGPGGDILSYNTAAEELLRLPLAPYRGVPVLASGGVFPLASGNEALAEVLTGVAAGGRQVTTQEVPVALAGGGAVLLEMTVQRREWVAGAPALVFLFRDASEKRRIRDEIRRADQLAFLGSMAARVAHEIRTPLATVRGLLELLQQDLPESDGRRAYIDRVLQALDRQDRLVEELLTLTHPEPKSWNAVSLPELVGDVLALLPADPRLRVDTGDPAALPPVWGDPLRLGEVLTNLVRNALESTPDTGTVEVSARAEGSLGVEVRVRNTGVGIPLDLRERIFQPFFTTKSRGTGLGLAIARQIVEAHRGRIRVESDGRSESTFIVELPAAAPAEAGAPAAARVR
jgi:two-component system sensor histidine kinase PilS (NtrC family)